MKPIRDKYVVCKTDDNGAGEVQFFTNDRKGNKVPKLYDSLADAIIEIGGYFISMGEAALVEDVSEESLNEPFALFIARIEVDKDGNMLIDSLDGVETFYEGTWNKFIISNN